MTHSLKRRQKILELLEKRDFIRTNKLMEIFGISRSTIIRDLKRLENEGFIKKEYGGVLLSSNFPLPSYSIEGALGEQIEEKKEIAKTAASLIKNGDTIILGNGVTTKLLAERIDNSGLNIFIATNSLFVLDLFAAKNNRNIKAIGGDYDPETHSFNGEDTVKSLENLKCDMSFISVHGIDPIQGLTDRNSAVTYVTSAIIENSKRVIVLVDYSKFGRISLYKIIEGFKKVSTIVTDSRTDMKYIKAFKELGINVLVAERND